ncbi:hypothetical protein T265_02190 [Opisthorchis viverrini]|uniref:Uncharacterized protein n=1 Tax=Opisthorchis viverrini TaxID=6198 RepID=A0A075A7R7_OPIVI|nr:hypothetical protein T265_02190 [Opisthorchis viverrini]KER31690.1 hypothetical protein T265_02190 [Opisthorchis viverrini]
MQENFSTMSIRRILADSLPQKELNWSIIPFSDYYDGQIFNFERCNALSVPSCHATQRKHEGWDTARLPKSRQRKSRAGGRILTTDLRTQYVLATHMNFAGK